jgi:hypothetical protein
MNEMTHHPIYYGGEDNLYETIKVIEAWGLNFHLGNTVRYISRAGKKDDNKLEDLRKAVWYLLREINRLNREPVHKPEPMPTSSAPVPAPSAEGEKVFGTLAWIDDEDTTKSKTGRVHRRVALQRVPRRKGKKVKGKKR